MKYLNVIILVVIYFTLIWLIVFGLMRNASAQDDTALRLAQCIRAECDNRSDPEEHAAIAWALWKLSIDRGIPFSKQIVRYCSYAKRHNYRARKIWASTFEKPQWGRPEWWSRMKQWSEDFLDGRIPDPLDESVKYFGGEMDTAKPGCVEVKRYCNRNGQRCNIFYRCE